jgi:hypothetical protein
MLQKDFKDLKRADILFLHIGKAAGSQIGALSKKIGEQAGVSISIMPHQIGLRDIPRKKPFFFSIRNPMARFKSGFYSRKRQGLPLHPRAWTPQEAMTYADFEHANDLAEVLFCVRHMRHQSNERDDLVQPYQPPADRLVFQARLLFGKTAAALDHPAGAICRRLPNLPAQSGDRSRL